MLTVRYYAGCRAVIKLTNGLTASTAAAFLLSAVIFIIIIITTNVHLQSAIRRYCVATNLCQESGRTENAHSRNGMA